MRLPICLLAILFVAVPAVPAVAQAEYFTSGERVVSGGGFVQWPKGGVTSSGFQIEGMVTPRIALAAGFGRSIVPDPYGPFGEPAPGREVVFTTWSAGSVVYLGRQDLDGALTVSLGLSAGGVVADDGDEAAREPLLGVGAQATRLIATPSGSFFIAPNAGFALSVVLNEREAATTPSYGLGLGIGVRPGPSIVVTFDPSVSLIQDPAGYSTAVAALIGVAFAY